MCGLIGAVGNYKIDECVKALDELKGRGPDGSYSLKGDKYFLGLSRLSIVAPQDKELPFVNEAKNIFCTVNGEIYNFIEIRNDLINKGHIFRTQIDTEVVLHAYEEYGNIFVKKLNGIFSILIFDKKKNILFAARDQLGVKPLFYTKKSNCYYFSSLSKILSQMITPKSSINYRNLIKLYYRQSIPEPDTIFQDIFTIPSGCYAIVSNSNIKIQRFYKIESKVSKRKIKIEEFLEIFKNVIAKQSVFDTNKVAIAQSNGVDSMLIGKLLDNESLIGYNIPYNPYQSDYCCADSFNYKINVIDYVKYINEAYKSWINFSDQPPMDGFNTFLLTYGIKENTKVLFSGLGADELFNGYPQFNKLQEINSKDELIEKFLSITKVFPEKWLITNSNKYDLKFFEINNEIMHSLSLETSESIKNGNLVRELLIKHYLISCLLRDADNNSMYNGIELRVPYLDQNILEYSLSFNYKNFTEHDENKYIIKHSLNKLLGYTYKKEKEGFTLNYNSFLDRSDFYFHGNTNNAYRNWCLKNSKTWFLRNGYENSNINSK